MRHANEKHRVLSCFAGGVVDGASGMLFEHIIDVLQARDFAFANDVDPFVHPADGGSKRDAVITNFAGAFELLERFPNCVVCHLLHSNIVQLQQIKTELKKNAIDLELHARPDWDNPLPWPTSELLAIVDLESPSCWLTWHQEQESLIRATVGDSRRIWIVPRIGGLAISLLTVGGGSTLFPTTYAVDDWLDALHVRRLDDTLTRAAQVALDLIIELDGMRRFGLGTEERPVVEQTVQKDNERRLAAALVEFETLTEGKSVQLLLRQLSVEVAAGRVALAESIAALAHGRLMPGADALKKLNAALLMQDIGNALCIRGAKA